MKRMVIAVTLLLLAPLMTPASAAGTRQVLPFQLVVTACSGEQVSLTGEVLVIENTTEDANGGVHNSLSLVWQNVTGVSASGVTYHLVGGGRGTVNVSSALTLSQTFTTEYVITSSTAENLLVTVTLHITRTPNGDFTVHIDDYRSKCVG